MSGLTDIYERIHSGYRLYYNRIEKLERQAGSLPILFALFFQHGISNLAVEYTRPLPHWVVYFGAAAVISYIYIKGIGIKDISETAQNASEVIEDKTTGEHQSRISDYSSED